MTALTPEEIAQLRAHLANHPQAIEALQEIEDCDGDIEDAAISLALRSGQTPDTHEQWLADFSKRYRHIACQPRFRELLAAGHVSTFIDHLTQKTDCPALVATPIAIYISKVGVSSFCHTFDTSRR